MPIDDLIYSGFNAGLTLGIRDVIPIIREQNKEVEPHYQGLPNYSAGKWTGRAVGAFFAYVPLLTVAYTVAENLIG